MGNIFGEITKLHTDMNPDKKSSSGGKKDKKIPADQISSVLGDLMKTMGEGGDLNPESLSNMFGTVGVNSDDDDDDDDDDENGNDDNESDHESKSTDTGETTKNINTNEYNLPGYEGICEHLQGIMGGKLGKLSTQIATQVLEKIGHDGSDGATNNDTSEAYKKIFTDPRALQDMITEMITSLQSKIESGEMTKSEILQEGLEVIDKLKNIPGVKDLCGDMFGKLGNIKGMMGMMGKGGKMNVNAMQKNMEKDLRLAKMRERMKKRVNQKAINEAKTNIMRETIITQSQTQPKLTDDELITLFDTPSTTKHNTHPQKSKQNKKGNKK